LRESIRLICLLLKTVAKAVIICYTDVAEILQGAKNGYNNSSP
jgi:hypothetical protein